MNRQGSPSNPSGGIEWTHIFGPRTGYTANPVRGCTHQCKWRMPDGTIAICYAKGVAIKFPGKHYEHGFEVISWDPSELESIEREKEPCGIFIDSMSDLFGVGVKPEWINRVLETIRKCPQHVFFTLTKNGTFLPKFGPYPENMLVGISAPPTFMFDKELTPDQQATMLRKWLEALAACDAKKRWISIEPLSFDVSEIIKPFVDILDWIVIGAASRDYMTFQPRESDFAKALEVLRGKPVFFKGNLDRGLAGRVAGGWREEFPVMPNVSRIPKPAPQIDFGFV